LYFLYSWWNSGGKSWNPLGGLEADLDLYTPHPDTQRFFGGAGAGGQPTLGFGSAIEQNGTAAPAAAVPAAAATRRPKKRSVLDAKLGSDFAHAFRP
jgi:hypothetical protein